MTVALRVLSFFDTMKRTHPTANIQVTKDGPYLVNGGVPLSEQHIVTNAEGDSLDYREGTLDLEALLKEKNRAMA